MQPASKISSTPRLVYFVVDDFPFGWQAGLRALVACCRATSTTSKRSTTKQRGGRLIDL